VRAKYGDPAALVSEVHKMPGHAGFAYGFTAESRGARESWFLRIPPPNVQWRGTADVLRQVCALEALDGTDVPHCPVKWSGAELEWFGCPYFVVPKLAGRRAAARTRRLGHEASAATLRAAAEQAMRALAGIHRVAWREQCAYLGDPVPFAEDVERWDRFLPKLAEPRALRATAARARALLAKLPAERADRSVPRRLPGREPVLLVRGRAARRDRLGAHRDRRDAERRRLGGDVQHQGGVGRDARLDDPECGLPERRRARRDVSGRVGAPLPDVAWFRALAAYKFAIIAGFNLGLHRRGKRHDPLWEITALSVAPLLEHSRRAPR
jgi:aminoglycoside phosphotransferase (APT) family kinase protein